MAISSNVIGAITKDEIEKNKNQNINKYKIYFGVFFDGTSNNMIQAHTARVFRRKYAKRDKNGNEVQGIWGKVKANIFWGKERHNYEIYDLDENDAKEIDSEKDRGSHKEGKEAGYSNVAILHSKYKGISQETEKEGEKIIVYKIYVEGSGANDVKGLFLRNGLPAVGLGFGLGKTGVVALVSKAVAAVHTRLKIFEGQENKVELHFDVFGFSRGSACARLFSYLVRRNNKEKLEKREYEFGKYYCKSLYNKKNKRLEFLNEYTYSKPEEEPAGGTKRVDFLGIYDTVVSIGILRRKKTGNDSSDAYFAWSHNSINPLRAGFVLDRDFDGNLHDLNVKEYGMYAPQMGGIKTFHICAMDEFRENFALTDIGKIVPENCLELFLPGCHSDIGGGYICNNLEKIVLNKYKFLSLDNSKKNWPGKSEGLESCARVCIKSPESSNVRSEKLSIEAMQSLGWLPSGGVEKVEKKMFGRKVSNSNYKEKGEILQGLENYPSEEETSLFNDNRKAGEGRRKWYKFWEIKSGYRWWESDARIGWERKVPAFFSNVPLHLMAKKASLETTRKMFVDGKKYNEGDTTWEKGFYNIPDGLGLYYNEVKKMLAKSYNGNRYWRYPGGSYCSEEYKRFRLNYLHFTSEQKLGASRIWDVQNQVKDWVVDPKEGSKEGKEHLICRIVYHGDEEDAGNMHFMFNYDN